MKSTRVAQSLCALMLLAPLAQAQTEKQPDKPAEKPASPWPGAIHHLDPTTFVEQTYYLAHATEQNDANEITTALRNMLDPGIKAYLVPSQNAILVAAPPEQQQMAQKLIHDLDRPRQEVQVDIAVLQIGKGKRTLSPAQLLTDKETKVIARQQLTAVNDQRAQLKSGSKIPVLTTVRDKDAAHGEFQYIDVGMNVDMTPYIHDGDEVSMLLKIEDSSQSSTATIDGVTEPVINQHVVGQTVAARDGVTTVVASTGRETEDEVVFLVTPHIVRPAK